MQREEWFGEICRETVKMVPRRHRQFLDAVPHLDVAAGPYEPRLVAKAALVTFVCVNYMTAYSTNEIVAKLLASGLGRRRPE